MEVLKDLSMSLVIVTILTIVTMVQAVRDFPIGCGIKEAERKPLKVSETGRNKPAFGSRPTGKVKFWVPPCLQPKVTVTTRTQQRKPLKNADKSDSNISKTTSNCNDKLVKSPSVENIKPKAFVPTESVRNKSYLVPKSTAKVKFWDPNCFNESEAQKPEVDPGKEATQRERIKKAIAVFDKVYEQLATENRLKPPSEQIHPSNLPTEAAKVTRKRLNWVDPEKTVGHVCGVQIGDRFKYRSQLVMIGLHCQHQSGIDYADVQGKKLALSIVDSHRYCNESGSSDKLVYCGHGGVNACGGKLPHEDQKLEKGNLALKDSIDAKTPVRVIRKLQGYGSDDGFVYDGLYNVTGYVRERSAQHTIVFKFHLKRIPGQPPLHKMMNGIR